MQCATVLSSIRNDGHRRYTHVRRTTSKCQGVINRCSIAILNITTMWLYCGEIYGVGSERGHYPASGHLLARW